MKLEWIIAGALVLLAWKLAGAATGPKAPGAYKQKDGSIIYVAPDGTQAKVDAAGNYSILTTGGAWVPLNQ